MTGQDGQHSFTKWSDRTPWSRGTPSSNALSRVSGANSIDQTRQRTSISGCDRGFSGAKIKSAITAALHLAFADGAALDTDRLVRELNQTVPLSRMRPEEIAHLRQWGRQHARRASAEDAPM